MVKNQGVEPARLARAVEIIARCGIPKRSLHSFRTDAVIVRCSKKLAAEAKKAEAKSKKFDKKTDKKANKKKAKKK